MELSLNRSSTIVFLSLLLLAVNSAAVNSLSDSIFGSDDAPSLGRNLLQAKSRCPIDFESKNYTIITSRCKGPEYPPKLCCQAFKDFACPYSEDLNDLTNDCSNTMLSYINLYGKYPAGLFSSECKDGKIGLDCPALSPPQVADDSSGGCFFTNPSSLPMLTATFLIFLLR